MKRFASITIHAVATRTRIFVDGSRFLTTVLTALGGHGYCKLDLVRLSQVLRLTAEIVTNVLITPWTRRCFSLSTKLFLASDTNETANDIEKRVL